ncbi:MAG TPA: TlpA disulfide reductase family protein [Anaerolineales bacterium]|nr:TlpA disulfide reductase family protein [Anaerolineales bacterium]
MNQPEPKNRTPLFLTLVVAGVFLIGAALIPLLVRGQDAALQSAQVIVPPKTIDQAAPPLALTDLEGQPVSLEDYRGKVVLVNNWATWCPPCQAEMPEILAYYQAHATDGFVVVGIESGEPAKTVLGFVQQYKLTFPVWLDPDGSAVAAFNNWNLPSSYVIDPSGTMRLTWTGPVTQATLDKYVTPLLEK